MKIHLRKHRIGARTFLSAATPEPSRAAFASPHCCGQECPRAGVALVITLIMLSVITVMAVAFLALSRRERSSVVHSANAIDAELMASSGAERGKAEILAYIITYSNYTGPGLLVSGARTNYAGNPQALPDYYGDPRDGTNDSNDRTVIAQLRLDAHPPVFVGRNREQRFYLDLNRNGRYDTNGLLEVLDDDGFPIQTTNGIAQAILMGDPEWYGVLSRPYEPHSRDNRFIGRYAFFIVPVGLSLDLNFIHNQGKDLDMTRGECGYFRNQGLGTWELNLAAFLADLNTNAWNPGLDYFYNTNLVGQPLTLQSRGTAFLDALELLAFRCNGSQRNLDPASAMLSIAVLTNFAVDGLDAYCNGPLFPLGSRSLPNLQADGDNAGTNWPGADSRKHLFSVHDFFDDRKTPNYTNFIDHLRGASAGIYGQGRNKSTNIISSYDRYTFYRMLSQLATDSVAERDDRININYNNLNGYSATNLVGWQRLEFFTNATHRVLREEFPYLREEFGTNVALYSTIYTNLLEKRIPVLLNGMTEFTNANNIIQRVYCPRIHQILQLCANIFEATTEQKDDEREPYFPTVFRPVFQLERTTTNYNIFIVDWVDETGPGFYRRVTQGAGTGQMRWHTLDDPSSWFPQGPTANANFDTNDFFYGVPFIVGAKKGFPNFNELALQTMANFSRKLQFLKDSPGDTRPKHTNQMFVIGVSNAVAVEAWNSYDRPYPRDLRMICGNVMGMTLTNDAPLSYSPTTTTNNGGIKGADILIRAGDWGAQQFRVPLIGGGLVLTDSVYRLTPVPHFEPIGATNSFETAGASYTNRWGMTLTNKLLFFLFDDEYKYLVDVVSLANKSHLDISGILNDPQYRNSPVLAQFITDRAAAGGVSVGVMHQIQVSLGNEDASVDWVPYAQAVGDKQSAIQQFQQFMNGTTNMTNMQAPFTPIARIVQTTRWEANDPLVHYYPADMETLDSAGNPGPIITPPRRIAVNQSFSITNESTIGRENARYRPWGHGRTAGVGDPLAVHPGVRDSGMWSSKYWDFPTQKFPTVGWIGRVHRGTPWQTAYFKGGVASRDEWLENQSQAGPGNSLETHPTNDWRLVDYFTTALHPNAMKGRLSVNQTNQAAWSAVLSGVLATKLYTPNGPDDPQLADQIVQPAALEPAVLQIFEGICRERDRRTNQFGRFERLSDILAVPELTIASPFLNPPYTDNRVDKVDYLRDIDYERIPDQIMSLLKLGEPRFQIYAFGQSLKPEYIDPGSGVAWNYQITGEVATRSLVRVEFEPLSTNPQDSNYLKPDVYKPHIVVEQFNILPPE